IRIEAPGAPLLHEFEPPLVAPVEEAVPRPALGILVGQLHRLAPEPLHRDHGDGGVGEDPTDDGVRAEIFEDHDSVLETTAIGAETTPTIVARTIAAISAETIKLRCLKSTNPHRHRRW